MAIPLTINLRNPRMQTLAGNAFYTVTQLTNWDAGHVEFVTAVDGKFYGTVYIPDNITPGAPTIKLFLAANNAAASKNVYMNVSFFKVTPGSNTLDGTFTASTVAQFAVPTTAYQLFTASFTANLTTPVVGDEWVVEIFRNAASANDTLTTLNLWLLDAILLT